MKSFNKTGQGRQLSELFSVQNGSDAMSSNLPNFQGLPKKKNSIFNSSNLVLSPKFYHESKQEQQLTLNKATSLNQLLKKTQCTQSSF